MKALRGIWLEVFGYTHERPAERMLAAEYQKTIDDLLAALTSEKYPLAVEIAALLKRIRGYGEVKARNMADVKRRETELRTAFFGGRVDTPLA